MSGFLLIDFVNKLIMQVYVIAKEIEKTIKKTHFLRSVIDTRILFYNCQV